MNLKSKGVVYLLLTIIMLIISILSIWFISHYFGDKDLFLSLGFLTPPVILKLCVLLTAYFLFDTLRFFYVLKTLGIQISFWYMVKLTFVNTFVSNITPMATGGGFAQIYFLSKKDVSVGSATAASTIRTMLPILFFFVSVPLVLLRNRSLFEWIPGGASYAYIGLILFLYAAILVLLYLSVKDIKKVKALIYKMVMGLRNKKILSRKQSRRICLSLFREVNYFSLGFRMFLGGRRRNFALSIMFTLLFLLASFLFPLILLQALGYSVSLLYVVEMLIVITFLLYFAPTPGATGVAEGGFALIFSHIVSKGDVATLTLTWRFFSIYVGVVIGLVIFYYEAFRSNSKP